MNTDTSPTPVLRSTLHPAIAVGAALAATTLSAAPPQGQLLASMCYQCHGTNGLAVSGFESIAGKSAPDMYKTLLEMSQRPPETIMDLQARAFTPDQLRQIANYLAALPVTSPTAP
jgi:cytochrome subunit of sulfide dehydrogenase